MNDLKISVENLNIVQPDFEYLSVINGDAWVEYGVQKFWLDFTFDGENLSYENLENFIDIFPRAFDFDDEDDFFEAQENAQEEFFDIDQYVFDEIMNQLVDRFPATLEELNRKRSEEEESDDE